MMNIVIIFLSFSFEFSVKRMVICHANDNCSMYMCVTRNNYEKDEKKIRTMKLIIIFYYYSFRHRFWLALTSNLKLPNEFETTSIIIPVFVTTFFFFTIFMYEMNLKILRNNIRKSMRKKERNSNF